MSTMTNKLRSHKLYQSQDGMVAIMVTMIMIVVITLIVLGFAQIIRRNQRQALDHQLSTQAFYAAESGVNDARRIVQAAVDSGAPTIYSKTTCGNPGGAAGSFYYSGTDKLQPDLNAAAGVKYVCLLVDATPTELVYDTIGTTSTIIPITPADGSNVSTITLEWRAKESATPMTGCPAGITDEFRNTSSWSCGYGVLRFDLVPTEVPPGNFDVNKLTDATMTSFAVPVTAGGETSPIPYQAGTSNTKNVFGASCDNTYCTATINVASKAADSFHLRVSSIYKDVSLRVRSTTTTSAGSPAQLSGAQVTIDSTGKAQDITRRIKVTVPVRGSSNNALPDYALQSTDSICKRFAVMDNYYSAQMPSVNGNVVQGQSDNELCKTYAP